MEKVDTFFQKINEKIIRTFTCAHCKEQVTQKQLVIPFGPHKDEKIIANFGCKCADIKIAQEAREKQAQLRQQKLYDMFQFQSLLNPSLQNANFANYKPPTSTLAYVKAKLEAYVDNFHPKTATNILLAGNYGVGKSHLAVSVAKALMKKGYTALFISVPKWLTLMKQSYQAKAKITEADIFSYIEQTDFFVLDDLGAEYYKKTAGQSSWTETKLFELLDCRQGKPSLFTTNLHSRVLQERLNERNFSRLMYRTKVYKMTGEDYRMREWLKYN